MWAPLQAEIERKALLSPWVPVERHQLLQMPASTTVSSLEQLFATPLQRESHLERLHGTIHRWRWALSTGILASYCLLCHGRAHPLA